MKFGDLTARQRDVADERFALLNKVNRMRAAGLDILSSLSKAGISKATYHRWSKALSENGIDGLADRTNERRGGSRVMPEHHVAFMAEELLQLERPHVKTVYDITYPMFCDSIGEKPVSYSTFLREFNKIPTAVKIKFRQGYKAYQDSQPFITRDLNQYAPLEIAVSDHYQMDQAMIGKAGKPVFPWVTWWIDTGSRHPLGWVLSEKPNQDTINLSLQNVIMNYGIPETVYIDNGRDYKSKMFTGMTTDGLRFKSFKMDVEELAIQGIYQRLKIDVMYSLPYNAKAKLIEPAHRTLHNIERLEYGYRGTGPGDRTSYMAAKIKGGEELNLSRLPDFKEMQARLTWIMLTYSEKKHKGLEFRTPKEVIESRLHEIEQKVEDVDIDLVNHLMLKPATKFYRVSANGIRFNGEWYYADELLPFEGGKVALRYDPDKVDERGNVRTVIVYDAKDVTLCAAHLQGRAPAKSAKAEIFEELGHRKKARGFPVDKWKEETQSMLQRLAERDFGGMPDA